MLKEIVKTFWLPNGDFEIQKLTSGLINHTWKVSTNDAQYVLQQVNTSVFTAPHHIAQNVRELAAYLEKKYPEYIFIAPLQTINGDELVLTDTGEAFRLMPYVENSQTIQTVTTTTEAFEAARQFGKFTSILSDFDENKLKYTLPDFHNLELRFTQFETSRNNFARERLFLANEVIAEVDIHQNIVETYRSIVTDDTLPRRVIHHDTKISNVLFDKDHKGICVIDLDTVMPGYIISDVGDMMRTYLSPANEEENDLSKVAVRLDFFRAVVEGYALEMAPILTALEKDLIIYSGKFMIYMQTIRFLTDFLNGDIYYPTAYPDHNLDRAKNQLQLLKSYLAAENEFERIIVDVL